MQVMSVVTLVGSNYNTDPGWQHLRTCIFYNTQTDAPQHKAYWGTQCTYFPPKVHICGVLLLTLFRSPTDESSVVLPTVVIIPLSRFHVNLHTILCTITVIRFVRSPVEVVAI